MTAQKFNPISLQEIAGETFSIVLAAQRNRYLEAKLCLFMVSPAVTLFKAVQGKEVLYEGKFLDKAVNAYNGLTVLPDETNEIHPFSAKAVAQKDDFGSPILRRRYKLL